MIRHIGSGFFCVGFGLFFPIGGLRNTSAFSRMGIGKYGLGLPPAEQEARVQRAHRSLSFRIVGVIGGLILIAMGIDILFWLPPFNF